MPKTRTKHDRAEVRKFYYDNRSTIQRTARHFGLSPATVYNYLRRDPDYAPISRCPWNSKQLTYMKKLRREGWTIRRIAQDAFHCSPSQLYYWLRRDPDYKAKPPGRRPGAGPKTLADRQKARQMRAEGKTFQDIADALGVSRQWAHVLVSKSPTP